QLLCSHSFPSWSSSSRIIDAEPARHVPSHHLRKSLDRPGRCQTFAGLEFAERGLACREHLDLRAADVDHQDRGRRRYEVVCGCHSHPSPRSYRLAYTMSAFYRGSPPPGATDVGGSNVRAAGRGPTGHVAPAKMAPARRSRGAMQRPHGAAEVI